MSEKETHEKPLTIREKLTIHLMLALIKVLKPSGWDIEQYIKDFKKTLEKA